MVKAPNDESVFDPTTPIYAAPSLLNRSELPPNNTKVKQADPVKKDFVFSPASSSGVKLKTDRTTAFQMPKKKEKEMRSLSLTKKDREKLKVKDKPRESRSVGSQERGKSKKKKDRDDEPESKTGFLSKSLNKIPLKNASLKAKERGKDRDRDRDRER